MKTILVPIDFSEYSKHALRFAIEFNKKLNGQIILLHVVEYPANAYLFMEDLVDNPSDVFYDQFVKNTQERLSEWSEMVNLAGQPCSIQLEYGNAFEKISKTIGKKKADWVIMGSKGASGLKEVFIGSNAERIIRHAEPPVIVVKRETSLEKIESMVFATDAHDDQDLVALKAKEIQGMFGLKMYVVKVRTVHLETEEAAWKELLKLAKRSSFSNYTLQSIKASYAEEGIVAFAEKKKAGLIIIGTHGRTGLSHLIGGSMVENLVNHSRIPIVSLNIKR